MECSCQAMELDFIQYRLYDLEDKRIRCNKTAGRICDQYQMLNPSKLCVDWMRNGHLKFFNVWMKHTAGFISTRTNFNSEYRVLFVDLHAKQNTCGGRNLTLAHHKCYKLNQFIGHFDLNDIVEIRHAAIISITAIPVLLEFGAWPLHVISVQRVISTGTWRNWLDEYQWLSITYVLIILCGGVTGLVCGICWPAVRRQVGPTQRSALNQKKCSTDIPPLAHDTYHYYQNGNDETADDLYSSYEAVVDDSYIIVY